MADELTISYSPAGGNGKISLIVKSGDKELAIDKIDVLSASARERFAKSLCKDRPGIDRETIDSELLRIAGEHQAERDKGSRQDESSEELDVSRFVRPERFLLPDVSGLTVGTPILRDGAPAGNWTLYLHWADGKREAIALPDSLALPDGATLWVFPTPAAPSPTEPVRWSNLSRKAWLDGAEPVDPAEVFQKLCKCIAYFVDFPECRAAGTTATLALWAVLTYCYPAWSAIPYLYLGGPAESGKTRVFEVLSRLVFRPLQSSNLSAASLFRTLHSKGGTLLFDEAERLKESAPDVSEVKSMLLAGYKRGGRATRLEPVGDTFKTVEFDVYGPKAMACIRGLPPALASRCISTIMFRAAKDSPKPRRRIDAHAERWQTLRDDLHRLAMDWGRELVGLPERKDVCPPMSGRNYELWQPLFALASWFEYHGANGLLAMMQEHAAECIESGQDEQTPDCEETLLKILVDAVRLGQSPQAKDLLAKAMEEDSRTFTNWSPKGVGNALRRYGIVTRKVQGKRTYGNVTLDDLRNVQSAYGLDLGLTEPGETP
jgi:hypothetical protein